MNVHSQPARETKRGAILDAALSLFVDRGFDGTAVPEVARAAGVAAGTIYRHFDSKEQLVNVLYRQCKAAMMQRLLAGFPFTAAPREQFHVFWRNLSAFARDEPRAFRFLELHHHAPYLDEASLAMETASLAPVGEFLARTEAEGITKPMPAAALVSIVWGAFVRLIKSEQEGHLELTDELLQQVEQACWDAITP